MTDALAKLRLAYDGKLAEAKKLSDEWAEKDEDMPEEVAEKIDGLLSEVDELKTQIERVAKISQAEHFMDDPAGPKAAHLGWTPAKDGEGDPEVDERDWREYEAETPLRDHYGAPVVKTFRYFVPLAVQAKGYPPAFEAYLRRGKDHLGPQDLKTLTEGVDSAGGFMVPADFQMQIIKKIATLAIIRSLARVSTTSRDVVQWPRVVYNTDDEFTSAIRLTWTGESPSSSTVHRVTDQVFGLASLPVHTAMASQPLSNDLLEDDAFDVAGISSDLFGEAFSLGEDTEFINGDGIGKPKGILTDIDTNDGPTSVDSGDAALVTADGLIDLIFNLPSQYERNGRVVMEKATELAIRKLKDSNNNYLWPVWPQGGGFAPSPRELIGFPVLRDEFLPSIAANAFPIIFGDFMGYYVVDRVGLSIQRLTELFAETNVTLLLARRRVGGQLVEPYRLRVQKISA